MVIKSVHLIQSAWMVIPNIIEFDSINRDRQITDNGSCEFAGELRIKMFTISIITG